MAVETTQTLSVGYDAFCFKPNNREYFETEKIHSESLLS